MSSSTRMSRGGSCTNCRQRRIKCDGSRPKCSNCTKSFGRFGNCTYQSENEQQRDRANIGSEASSVLLHNPYADSNPYRSVSPLSCTTIDSYFVQLSLDKTLSLQLRQALLSTFFEYSADIGFFLDQDDFFHSVMSLSFSSRIQATFVSALAFVVFLVSSHFSTSLEISALEPLFLLKAKESRAQIISASNSYYPRWKRLQIIQTQILFAQYFFIIGCKAEAKCFLANAVSTILSARMHHISFEQDSFMARGSLQASKEEVQSISAFWTVLSLNSCWTAMEMEDSTNFPYWIPEFRVDTPWPQTPFTENSGPTIQKFLANVPDNADSIMVLQVKACILLEQASQLAKRYNGSDMPPSLDATSQTDFAMIFNNLLSLTIHFISRLPHIPSSQQPPLNDNEIYHFTDSSRRRLLVIHTLARTALIRLYSLSEMMSCSAVYEKALARQFQVEAAKEAAWMIALVDFQQATFIDPIMAALWSTIGHVLFTSIHDSGTQLVSHDRNNFSFFGADLQNAFNLILEALSISGSHNPLMKDQLVIFQLLLLQRSSTIHTS